MIWRFPRGRPDHSKHAEVVKGMRENEHSRRRFLNGETKLGYYSCGRSVALLPEAFPEAVNASELPSLPWGNVQTLSVGFTMRSGPIISWPFSPSLQPH